MKRGTPVGRLGAVAIALAALDGVGLTLGWAFRARRGRASPDDLTSFVATAAHELRTPLTSLHLTVDLLRAELQREPPGLEAARELAERAVAQSARSVRVAGDVLDFSRFEAAVPLRVEAVDLLAVASAVITEFSVPGGVALRLQPVGEGPLRAQGDRDGVARILRIVLENALRFAPRDTAVTVTPYLRDGVAAIAVCDLGPGVREQDAAVIFERFRRGGDGPITAGFGVGLAIGRGLARAMGGDLRLRSSRSPTCFSLELPAWRVGRNRPLPDRRQSAPSPGFGHEQR